MLSCVTLPDSTSSCHQELAAQALKQGQLLEYFPVQKKCANKCDLKLRFLIISSAVWAHTITITHRKSKQEDEKAPPRG